MTNGKSIKGVVCGACLLAASGADGQELEPAMSEHNRVTSLKESIEPLREHFNAQAHGRRFVALFSSTCALCVSGAEAVRKSVLGAYPDAALSVTIIWVDMLGGDGEATAMKSAEIFDDVRVRQFYDPTSRSSTLFAKDVLYADGGLAWDMYLYYELGATWDAAPPKPEEWYHQLSGGKRGDPKLFRTDQELVDQLRESTSGFMGRWDRAGERFSPTEDLQILAFEGCPNSETVRVNLADALERMGERREWNAVDLEALEAGDALLRYGSPTLLVRGRDLFGQEPQNDGQLTCRMYMDGLPTSKQIEARLRELIDDINGRVTDKSGEPIDR